MVCHKRDQASSLFVLGKSLEHNFALGMLMYPSIWVCPSPIPLTLGVFKIWVRQSREVEFHSPYNMKIVFMLIASVNMFHSQALALENTSDAQKNAIINAMSKRSKNSRCDMKHHETTK